MLKGKVVATANSTLKHESLEGRKLLLVQPYGPDARTPDGHPLLTLDTGCGAGVGDEIMMTSDGRAAREALGVENTPVRWTVIGIVDP